MKLAPELIAQAVATAAAVAETPVATVVVAAVVAVGTKIVIDAPAGTTANRDGKQGSSPTVRAGVYFLAFLAV